MAEPCRQYKAVHKEVALISKGQTWKKRLAIVWPVPSYSNGAMRWESWIYFNQTLDRKPTGVGGDGPKINTGDFTGLGVKVA